MRSVFFATDDEDVISQRVGSLKQQGFNVTWTKDEKRWSGGSPQTAPAFHHGHHDNDDAATAALLDDIAGLARASVLIGSFASNFFRVAWFLNAGLHAGAAPRGPWCYDLFVAAPCDDLNGQVMAYCRERAKQQACDLARMEQVCPAPAPAAAPSERGGAAE